MEIIKKFFATTTTKYSDKCKQKSKSRQIKLFKKAVLALLVFIPLFFLAQTSIHAATYYVDTTVTDTNVGSATPDFTTYDHTNFTTGSGTDSVYKTIADVNAKALSQDDQVLFRKGQIWREQLVYPSSGASGHPITYGAFGSGAAPIISSSDLITAGWSKDSTNIWKATVTTQPYVVFFNGTRGTPVAAKANITAEFNWFWSANVLYVWSPPDSDPSLYYTSPGIEAGSRSNSVRTGDKSYVTVDGLTIRDGNSTNALGQATINVGSVSVTGIVFQNCTVERGAWAGFALKGSTTAASVTIDHCTIQNNGGFGIFFSNQYTTATISNSTITGNGIQSVADAQQYSGIQGQLGNANIFGNSISANSATCSTLGLCHGVYANTSTATANIYQNTIFSNPTGAGVKLVASANVYKNNIYSNGQDGITSGQNGANNVTYVIYSNLIYGNNTTGGTNGIVEQSKGAGTLSLTLENNTLYQNGGTTQFEIKISDNLTALTMKNNILFATATRRTINLATQTGTVAIDNNLQWRADGNPNITSNGSIITWAAWQALGYDTHGVNLDPALTNAGGNVFTLLSTSPAINTGTNVSLASDYAGTSIPQGAFPDMGAYEFRSPSTPTSLAQYKSDGTTVISSAGWTNETSAVFKFSMSSTNASDSLTPYVEIQTNATPFTNVKTNSGNAVAYSGSPVTGSVTVTGLTDGTIYHWQASATNSASLSSWVTKGGNPDFGVDTSAPSGGSITYTDGYFTTASVALTASDGTDSSSGINTATRTVQRKSATLTNGSCGGYGGFGTITPTGSYPNYTDSTVASGNCYQYQYLVSDNAGNQATYTSTNTAKIDTANPSGGSITYTDGYYTAASVALTAADGTDSVSGINTASRTVQRKSATLTNGTCGGYGGFGTITPSGSYPNFTDTTVSSGNCYQYQYLVSDNAGNQATYTSTNTAKIDTANPSGGSITYTDGYYTSASVALTAADGTDSVSGINTGSRIVQRKSATLTVDTCGSYGSFGTITPTGTYPNFTDSTVSSGNCYQYRYLVSDNAGNQAIYISTNTAKADTIAPDVTINQAAGQTDPTNNTPINFTVTFTEPVSDFATGDVTLSGTAGATTGTVTGSGTTYNVAVTGMTGSGTVIASIAVGKAHDVAGNSNTVSTASDNSVTYSIDAPTLTSITISDSSGFTNNPTPTITIVSSGSPSNVAFSCNGGTNWSSWIAYASTISTFNITNGATGCTTSDGSKTITAKLKDSLGNESGLASDTTFYDTTGPTGSITNASGDPTNDTTPTLNLTIADSGVGVIGAEMMRFSCDNSTWTNWEAYVTPKTDFNIKPGVSANGCGTTDGARTVYVQFRDSLQNAGASYNTGSFTLDTTAPVLTSITIIDASGSTNSV